jgi:hypothetical protein
MRLDPADIEQIAQRVADLTRSSQMLPPGQYVDAAELARLLGVERDWVYAHADALGAIRLGGPRGRLRFDLQSVQQSLPAARSRRSPARRRRSKAGRARATRAALIPYESEQLGIIVGSNDEGRA